MRPKPNVRRGDLAPSDGDPTPPLLVDAAGHRVEVADGGAPAWIHAGGPNPMCAVVALLREPTEDILALPGWNRGFRERRQYAISFEVDGEARP